jgi:hypothetical protein
MTEWKRFNEERRIVLDEIQNRKKANSVSSQIHADPTHSVL